MSREPACDPAESSVAQASRLCPAEAFPPADSHLPLQFGLKTLLVAMAVVAALCAVAQVVSGYAFLVLLFFLALIAAHVLGNSLGTRLRAQTDRLAASGLLDADRPPLTSALPARLASGRLAQHRRLPRALAGLVLSGAAFGGLAGGLVIAAVCCDQITPPGIVLAVVSSAALGGLAGFLAGSFYTVARGALDEALGKTPRE